MPYTTRAEKLLAQAWVHRYINADHKLSIRTYTRLMSWLGGLTFAEIAAEESVTPQAIAQTVTKTVREILQFAKDNDYDYNISTSDKKGTRPHGNISKADQ